MATAGVQIESRPRHDRNASGSRIRRDAVRPNAGWETLVREADEALNRPKETGRTRVLHGSTPVPMLLTRRG